MCYFFVVFVFVLRSPSSLFSPSSSHYSPASYHPCALSYEDHIEKEHTSHLHCEAYALNDTFSLLPTNLSLLFARDPNREDHLLNNKDHWLAWVSLADLYVDPFKQALTYFSSEEELPGLIEKEDLCIYMFVFLFRCNPKDGT